MVYNKEAKHVKKLPNGRYESYIVTKKGVYKGGMVRGQTLFPGTKQEIFIPRPPDSEGGQGAKVDKKNIISEIDRALSTWNISDKPKKQVKGGFLGFLDDLF